MSSVYKGLKSYVDPILRGDMSDVYIGNFTSIAQGVVFDCGFHHNYNFTSTFPFNVFYPSANHIKSHPKTKGDIHIGSDVWIGEGCLIMGGVKIGDGAVIGSRSVVTRDVEPYSIRAGVPCSHIKYRFSTEIIKELLKIKWWDWNEDEIEKCIPLLMDDVNQFISKYKR
jgi:virginiamycin A acetyltransferase